MGKTEKSEVNVICGSYRTTIPLHFLLKQSERFAAVLAPPVESLYFGEIPSHVIEDTLYFCRFARVKDAHDKDLSSHLKFAERWEMNKFINYLNSVNQITNKENYTSNQPMKDENKLKRFEENKKLSLHEIKYNPVEYYTKFQYIQDAKIFKDGIRIIPDNMIIPAGGINFKIQLINSNRRRLAFKIVSTNTSQYFLDKDNDFIEPFSFVFINITRMAGLPRNDQMICQFAQAANAQSPKVPFKRNYPTTEIIVEIDAK